MKLSVVIPAYNEEAYLHACLESVSAELQANAARGAFEIVVIDNASTDGTAQVASLFPLVRVVAEPRKGLTHARQCGLEAARGEILAYVDADTRMPPGWIGRALDAYERDSSVVCVSGPYVYDELSRVKRTFVQLYWRLLAMPMYRFTHYMAVGGNFAASKAALLRIGGFDTTISFYGEDTNIARRLAQEGKVVFDLRLVMKTSARRLQDEGFATTAVRYALNFGSEVLLKRPFTRQYRDIR